MANTGPIHDHNLKASLGQRCKRNVKPTILETKESPSGAFSIKCNPKGTNRDTAEVMSKSGLRAKILSDEYSKL
ncbi:hypothetical protein Ciccas_012115 [Cichlidogyrus casuarinus]|uniref:Uncharacterized protein n=1 Tax=Cichlidogyrus casuarinus TaxID=1844966 RepID=A0ABD2PR34_9PLAT